MYFKFKYQAVITECDRQINYCLCVLPVNDKTGAACGFLIPKTIIEFFLLLNLPRHEPVLQYNKYPSPFWCIYNIYCLYINNAV